MIQLTNYKTRCYIDQYEYDDNDVDDINDNILLFELCFTVPNYKPENAVTGVARSLNLFPKNWIMV